MGDASERSRGDSNILGVAVRLCEFLETCKYTYFVIGGIAVQRWGEPRQTVDVDVTVIVEFGDEERVAKHVLQSYEARVDEPLRFAVENRVYWYAIVSESASICRLVGCPMSRERVSGVQIGRFPVSVSLELALPRILSS